MEPIGTYVLATKYDDGDPCDHFAVGFVSGYTHHGRYLTVDNAGAIQRHNGFRRAEKITDDEGRKIVELMPTIGNVIGPSLWWHLATIRGEVNPPDLCEGYYDHLPTKKHPSTVRETEVANDPFTP